MLTFNVNLVPEVKCIFALALVDRDIVVKSTVVSVPEVIEGICILAFVEKDDVLKLPLVTAPCKVNGDWALALILRDGVLKFIVVVSVSDEVNGVCSVV